MEDIEKNVVCLSASRNIIIYAYFAWFWIIDFNSLQANESVIVSRETISHLFAHEAMRVFHDRLNDPEDRKTFFNFLSDDLHNYFKVNNPNLFLSLI